MSGHGRRVLGWATMVAGLGALAVAAAVAWWPAHAPADAGTLPAAVATINPDPDPAPRRTLVPPPPPAPDSWTPARLDIDRLRVSAPVTAAGVTSGGDLAVPEDPSRLGWWIGSARPGDPRGTVLVAGHVDTARDGKGALFRLEDLPLGATIEVRAGDRTVSYRSTARRSYAKTRLPGELFRRTGPAQLALVTCGGAFRDGAYDHNVVVYAVPVP